MNIAQNIIVMFGNIFDNLIIQHFSRPPSLLGQAGSSLCSQLFHSL